MTLGTLDWRGNSHRGANEHYVFEVGGKRLLYSYMRKNGCSAFKRLILGTSPYAGKYDGSYSPLQFMNNYHRLGPLGRLRQRDACIFVYRDPFSRLISAFNNKFIVRKNSQDFFASYHRVMGAAPEQATFHDFVSQYCTAFEDRDPHIIPQAHHLLPIKYNAAIALNGLCEGMSQLIGPTTANTYFGQKANATIYSVEDDDLSQVPAETLRQAYIQSGSLPSRMAFETNALRASCATSYADDYAMIASIQ